MDYSKMSDEELKKIAGADKYGKMSDEELMKMAGLTELKSDLVEEMHPDVSWSDRAIVKNLANNNQESINYLKGKYKDHDIEERDGRIAIKRKDEKQFRVLDPDTGFFSKDILHDAGDVLFDVGSGTLEGIAATMAGLPTSGLGAAPAAAATAAGSEAVRQALGKMAGVHDFENSTGEILQAGAAGAIFPAVGKVGNAAWKGAKKVAPNVGSWLSGLSTESIEMLRNYLPDIKRMETHGIASDADDVIDMVRDVAGSYKDDLGKNYQKYIDEAGGIDLSETVKVFDDEIAKASSKQGYNKYSQDQLDQLIEVRQNLFGDKTAKDFASVTGDEAQTLKGQLKDLGYLERDLSDLSGAKKATGRVVRTAGNKLRSSLDNIEGLSEAGKAYQKALRQIKVLKSHLANPQKVMNTARGFDRPQRKELAEALDALEKFDPEKAGEIREQLRMIEMQFLYGKGSQSGLATEARKGNSGAADGLGSTGAILANMVSPSYAAIKAGAYAGRALGQVVGSPKMVRRIIEKAPAFEKGASKYSPWALGGGRVIQKAISGEDEE